MTPNDDALRWASRIDNVEGGWETADQCVDHIRRLVAENEALKADRDSWADQASERLKDWDEMRQKNEALTALLRQAVEAMDIGHEYAHDCAETFHREMAGYKQKRHDAMDAEVKQLADTIAAIRQYLEGKS